MALYQKYRPLRFADVAGQEAVKTTLQNEIATGTTVHAYLFSGPRAVGKTTTARLLARALNCERRKAGEYEPCNECESCMAILSGRALDVMEIDAASNNSVDNVRDTIMGAARVANSQLKVKVFILDEVHMLSTAAFNALLKTLEEPPENVVFIMATTELHKVPATIVSRCQRFDFTTIAPEAMRARLADIVVREGKEVDEVILDEIVRRTGGCARDAESLLGQVLSLGDVRIDYDTASVVLPRSDWGMVSALVAAMIKGETAEGLSVVRRVVEEGVDMPTFVGDALEYMRAVLLVRVGGGMGLAYPQKDLDAMTQIGEGVGPDRLLVVLDYIMAAQRDSKWLSIPYLALEIAVVKAGL